jgi:hypothetical protein
VEESLLRGTSNEGGSCSGRHLPLGRIRRVDRHLWTGGGLARRRCKRTRGPRQFAARRGDSHSDRRALRRLGPPMAPAATSAPPCCASPCHASSLIARAYPEAPPPLICLAPTHATTGDAAAKTARQRSGLSWTTYRMDARQRAAVTARTTSRMVRPHSSIAFAMRSSQLCTEGLGGSGRGAGGVSADTLTAPCSELPRPTATCSPAPVWNSEGWRSPERSTIPCASPGSGSASMCRPSSA